MVETGILAAGQLSASTLQQSPQSLPASHAKDSERFQDLITGGKLDDTSIQPQPLEHSVLQFVEPGQNDTVTLVDKMLDQAARVDGNYHSLLDQSGSRPDFSNYASKRRDEPSAEMMTYPAVSTDEGNSSLQAHVDGIEAAQQSALEYHSDLSKWMMRFQIWSSGVELAASAAQKVSTTFSTLFRASG
ncbi:MAG: hypothetical protein CSA79_03665 [Thiothrix nivea]|nr:MAG: hypothetical protein CSA79_03665 [Thiothrix nivea]